MDESENEYELPDLDQLVDLLVYAPIGLLYEYQTVLPQLIKRGKSQVQLARVFGQFAVKQGSMQMNKQSGQAAETAISLLSTVLTEFGSSVGLAPPSDTAGSGQPQPDASADAIERAAIGGPTEDPASPSTPASPDSDVPLPIAGYDDLNARSIIDLLGDLTASQLERVRAYEADHRSRKTVLAKIDRLLA